MKAGFIVTIILNFDYKVLCFMVNNFQQILNTGSKNTDGISETGTVTVA